MAWPPSPVRIPRRRTGLHHLDGDLQTLEVALRQLRVGVIDTEDFRLRLEDSAVQRLSLLQELLAALDVGHSVRYRDTPRLHRADKGTRGKQ